MAILDQLGFSPIGLRRVSNKQLRSWAQNNGAPVKYIYTIEAGLNADPISPENIYYSGGDMVELDAVAVKIKDVLALSDADWSLAISDMLAYPH